MSDDVDEYAPTQALLDVPDLSGYDLPDLGLDDDDPPHPRPAAGETRDTTRAFNPDEAAAVFGLGTAAAQPPQPPSSSPHLFGGAPSPNNAQQPINAANPQAHFAQPPPNAPPPSYPQPHPSPPQFHAPPQQPYPQQAGPPQRPPMMSIGAIEIPPQPETMNDSMRLLLVFLGVGIVFALVLAAAALLVGA